MKLSKDNPATPEFALQSGKLIQNFGVVELISYRWIGALSGSAIAVEIAREVPLAKRIDIIVRLLGRDECALPAEKRGQATSLWKQLTDKGCELRNTIAHGTVGLVIQGDDPLATPTTVGVLKTRRRADTDELISIDELKGAVNTTAKIAEELHQLLEDPSGAGGAG